MSSKVDAKAAGKTTKKPGQARQKRKLPASSKKQQARGNRRTGKAGQKKCSASAKTGEEDADEVDEDLAMCCVCGRGDSEAENPIVFCDGCNIAVHKGCYGNPLAHEIPEGDWLCERCLWKAKDKRCVLCPVREGAMKRTIDWQWAHIACALWIPEVFCHYGDGLEPIDYFQVPEHRFKLKCDYCGLMEGACVECAHESCKVKFHISCGLAEEKKIVCEHKVAGKTDLILAFCSKHADIAIRMQGKKVKYYASSN